MQAMSGGGGGGGGHTITVNSLFAFDDSFGDGVDCLHAGTALRALSPSPSGGSAVAEGSAATAAGSSATMADFLRVAGELKLKHAALFTE